MSTFSDFADGFMDGLANPLSKRARGIEKLLRELGWSADERDGDLICLHFDGPGGVRKVYISDDSSAIADFSVGSLCVVATRNLSSAVPAYLLARNESGRCPGRWEMVYGDNGTATFCLTHSVRRDCLNAQILKWTCEALCNEAADFDGKMRQRER